MDDLVTVASFSEPYQGELAKERLESEGVRAFVIGAQVAGVMPYLAGGAGAVRVQVDSKDEARAREILGA